MILHQESLGRQAEKTPRVKILNNLISLNPRFSSQNPAPTMSEYAMSTGDDGRHRRKCDWSIEERNFVMILIMFEAHFSGSPPVGPRTMKKSTEILQETLKKSLERGDFRYLIAVRYMLAPFADFK